VERKKRTTSPSLISPPFVYYPAFLNLQGKRVVVVGGGKIAERKILGLLKTGADITVISPQITKKIDQARLKRKFKYISREYRKGDLNKAFLAIAATDSSIVNEKVSKDAPCLLNVVDTPQLCNFIVPSTVIRGPLTVAISTGGVSPALSRSIRTEIEKMYGSDFSQYVESLRKIRVEALEAIPDNEKRRRVLKALASERMLKSLRVKGFRETKKTSEDLFNKAKNAKLKGGG
jgi:precorrin-2 dehydrogenase/sirohydrochlorin ferrochelatase